jgi:thiol-disulfide isomerase/thioredoxin
MDASWVRRWSVWVGSVAVVLMAAMLSMADDDDPKPDDNPYLPREGLSALELRDFIERMQASPKTVQTQPGFTEAIGVAVDRLLATNPSEDLRAFGLINKLAALHRSAMYGDDASQKKLMDLVKQSKDNKNKELSTAIQFYQLEDRALDAGLNAKTEDLPAKLEELKKYFTAEPGLDRRHLRLASATVKIINRVADDELAQKSYKEFGDLWAKSQELELNRYGRKIAKGIRQKASDFIGKPMPFVGTTHEGKPFDVAQYRGKPVVVVFWATWCGPCRELMPEVKAIHEHFHQEGLQMVGVSQDDDRDALAAYIEQENIAWPNLFDVDPADSEKHPIAERYGVHGIPSTFVLDASGKVVAKDLHGQSLIAKIEELLDGSDDAKANDDAKSAAKKPADKKSGEEKQTDAPQEKGPDRGKDD